jgi:hypothetical protein
VYPLCIPVYPLVYTRVPLVYPSIKLYIVHRSRPVYTVDSIHERHYIHVVINQAVSRKFACTKLYKPVKAVRSLIRELQYYINTMYTA